GRRGHLHPFVLPAVDVVLALVAVPSTEQAVEVLGVPEFRAHDGGRVRVVQDVLGEPTLLLDDVPDDPAQEGDVAPGPYGHVDIGHRAGPGEPGVDVDDGGPPALRLHDPPKADRMALGEVRTLDHDAVGVGQVLLERGGPASSERDPQTGDRGAVSYPGLVLDLDDSQGRE